MANMLGSVQMETSVLDHDHVDNLTTTERRATRRHALGGALAVLRSHRGWTVSDAAAAATLAPMTWRRLEEGLEVRQRSHVAVDGLLELPFGSVQRALDDDAAMAEFVARFAGASFDGPVCDQGVFLRSFVGRRGAPVPEPRHPWPEVGPGTSAALAAMALHGQPERPTPLELVQRAIERLTMVPDSPAVQELLASALRALPDLIAHQVRTAAAEHRSTEEEKPS